MKLLISTLGSRGDTQPYLALAVGLQRAGHEVTLAAPQSFASWIQSYGVRAHPLRFEPQKLMQSLTASKNPLRAMRVMRQVMQNSVAEALSDCWQAAQETDFLLQSGTGSNALEIAAARGIPVAFAYLVPMSPTRAFPMFMLPFRSSLGGWYNDLTHRLMQQFLWRVVGRATTNRWRTQLDLPLWHSVTEMQTYTHRLGIPSLYGFSPSFLPKPADWDEGHHVTGYWFLDAPATWQPPPALEHFLADGPPPVYIGFGSMSHKNPERLTATALQALALSGQRGILATGWGSLTRHPVSPQVFFVEDVPHEWLFPQLVAVVHHGGAGTTAAGLRAGVPNIIIPFGGDQWAWADLVVKSGVGLRVGIGQRMTARKLAAAIDTAVTDSTLRKRAAALGTKIRAENGVGRAIALIESHARAVPYQLSTGVVYP